MLPRKVKPIKCLHNKLLASTHQSLLLEKYRFTNFLCFKAIIYPRLVRMFNANLATIDDKFSCYVIHKHMIIDFKIFGKEFDMDPSPLKLTIASFLNYPKDLAINILFPY